MFLEKKELNGLLPVNIISIMKQVFIVVPGVERNCFHQIQNMNQALVGLAFGLQLKIRMLVLKRIIAML